MIETIWQELNDARAQMRPLRCIRVTTDAIEGSPVAVPLTPERARLVRLLETPLGPVVDPETERLLELLVHPADWASLLRQELPGVGYVVTADAVMGIPVVGN